MHTYIRKHRKHRTTRQRVLNSKCRPHNMRYTEEVPARARPRTRMCIMCVARCAIKTVASLALLSREHPGVKIIVQTLTRAVVDSRPVMC